MEEEIKKDPHICVDLALWDLERALSDLQNLHGLIRHSDVPDLKSCMAQIAQIMLKIVNIQGQPLNQECAAC